MESSPLQEEKAEIVEDLKTIEKPETEKRGVKAGSKRGPYKKKATVKKPEPEPAQEYTEEDADRDSQFLCAMINEFRAGVGIPPMDNKHALFLGVSSKSMFTKYGPSTSKWMPEIMFGGSLFFVLLDTKKHLDIKRAAIKAEKAKKAKVNTTDHVKKPQETADTKSNDANFKDGKKQPDLSIQ